MGLLDDPIFKAKYQKSKYKVRIWESEFLKKNGCNPTKADIKLAPDYVKDSYKTYYKLKTLALEESLIDSFTDDTDDTVSQECGEPISFKGTLPESGKLMETPDKTKHSRFVLKEIQNEIECTDSEISDKNKIHVDDATCTKNESASLDNSNGVWGIHLNKSKEFPVNREKHEKVPLKCRSSSSLLSEKLFAGSKFKKRNPRKSFCKSLSMKRSNDDVANFAESESQDLIPKISSAIVEDGSSSATASFFMDKPDIQSFAYKIVKSTMPINCQATNIIDKALKESKGVKNLQVSDRKLDKAWLDRHTSSSSLDSGISISSPISNSLDEKSEDLPVAHSNLFMNTKLDNSSNQFIDSDEDFICNSESENETDSQQRIKLVSKRKLSDSSFCAEASFVGEVRPLKKLRLDSVPFKENGDPYLRTVLPESSKVPDIQFKSSKLGENFSTHSSESEVKKKVKTEITLKPNSVGEGETPTEIKHLAGFTDTNHLMKNEVQIDIEAIADEIVGKETHIPAVARKTRKKSKKEIFENKIVSGTANENFVRINIKKKVYVRGKKTMTFAKYKKMEWKKKKKMKGDYISSGNTSLTTCFKCGDIGHFSRNCTSLKGDKLLQLDEDDTDDSPFPTLDEVTAMASESVHFGNRNGVYHFSQEIITRSANPNGTLPENVIEELNLFDPLNVQVVNPIYSLKEDGTLIDTPREVYEVLQLFGHESFRPGQEEAIMRILSGLSTLLTIATGSGKSLCYQIPAFMFAQRSRCITLVISPLVSLMEDQVMRIASCLQAACLHTGQTAKQREKVLEAVRSGKLQILLISPEAVVSSLSSNGFGSVLKELPPIAFACVDEAHCVSQWSHNFRPSYLMICKVLKEKLKVNTILGLTATATKTTCASIVKNIGVPDKEKGVIKDIPIPENLILTVSKDENRDKVLVSLFTSTHFRDCQSVIIYCTRRVDCDRLAVLLRTFLQDNKRPESNARRSRISWNAEAYHAGLSAARRKAVQQSFMSGKLRIVVATVAFGMGINKKDIRAVIHYNMPSCFESYVQEVGRAGRDGLPAYCHLFLDSKGGDKIELRRHIHANSVDRHTVRKLLQNVFLPCKCLRISKLLEDINFEDNSSVEEPLKIHDADRNAVEECSLKQETQCEQSNVPCPGHEVAFSIDETVRMLDIPEENISTMLCYLELHPKSWIKIMSPVYIKCRILSYKGPKALKAAIRKSPPLAMAVALDQRRGISHENSSQLEFPVVDIASAIKWDSGMVKNHLKQLEWTKVDDKWRRTGISVEFSVLGFRVTAPGNLTASELDEALDSLCEMVESQEKNALQQLECVFEALSSVAYSNFSSISTDISNQKSDQLKEMIREYFAQENMKINLKSEVTKINEELVCANVRKLVCSYRDSSFTGRNVARIFHGIASPCFPAQVWGRCKLWRAHLDIDFHELYRLATKELLHLR